MKGEEYVKELENMFTRVKQLQEDYIELITENKGVITPEAEVIEEEIEKILNNKLDNVDELYYIKTSYEAELAKLKDLELSYTKSIKKMEASYDNLKRMIGKIMEYNGKSKLEGVLCSIKRRTAEDLVITNKALIPKEFYTVKTVEELNKTLLKQNLREVANDIEGAELKEYETITFYQRGRK